VAEGPQTVKRPGSVSYNIKDSKELLVFETDDFFSMPWKDYEFFGTQSLASFTQFMFRLILDLKFGRIWCVLMKDAADGKNPSFLAFPKRALEEIVDFIESIQKMIQTSDPDDLIPYLKQDPEAATITDIHDEQFWSSKITFVTTCDSFRVRVCKADDIYNIKINSKLKKGAKDNYNWQGPLCTIFPGEIEPFICVARALIKHM
jgi:hypothetical protein